MKKIILTTFTDPMMGLSYETEPVYEALKDYFEDRIVFRYAMAGLVRDVGDFMTPEELAMPEEQGLLVYNKRLAGILALSRNVGD